MKDLRGKTAFITGAASGIGLGMARAFGKAGMNVVIADIDKAGAQTAVEQLTSEQIKAKAVQVDVSERAAVRAAALEAVAAFGKVHVVCNNAGVAVGAPMAELTDKDWDWIIDVNLKGVVYGVETFAPLIAGHGEGGHIVNTASLAGILSGPFTEPYSATKFAVVGMTEGWAVQLAPQGIGLSALCPGFVRTQILNSSRNRQDRYGGVTPPAFGASPERTNTVGDLVQQGVDPDIVETRFAAIRTGFAAAAASPALKSVKAWAPLGGFQRQAPQ